MPGAAITAYYALQHRGRESASEVVEFSDAGEYPCRADDQDMDKHAMERRS